MRFTLRDFFWLILLIAVGTEFAIEHSRLFPVFLECHRDTLGVFWHSHDDDEQASRRYAKLIALRKLTDEEVRDRLDAVYQDREQQTCLLLEAARRRMIVELREYNQAIMQKANTKPYERRNHESLTALRRAELSPDPIQIEVQSIGKDWQGNSVSIPLIIPKVTNKDVDREPCYLTQGGDGGDRPSRWRVHLINEQGRIVKDAHIGLEGVGGGFAQFGQLQFGESVDWSYVLDARRYVSPPKSGKYKLQLVHSEESISNQRNLVGLVVWKSTPIDVIVENRAERSKWRAMMVPSGILVAAVGVMLWMGIRQRQRGQNAAEAEHIRRFSVRDWIAIVLLMLLSLAWAIDIFYMKGIVEQNKSHRHADWTMRVA